MLLKLFLSILSLTALAACSEPECTVNADPQLRIRFVVLRRVVQTNRFNPVDTNIRIVSVTATGALPGRFVSQVKDTTVTNNLTAVLSQAADETTFTIKWDTARTAASRLRQNTVFTETLTVGYQRQPFFVSEGCGFNYKYTGLEIKKETFTTSLSGRILAVSLIYPLADEELQPNVTITFRPRPR